MITGGAGSSGNNVLNRFLKKEIAEIRIFSRDEKKQENIRYKFQVKYPEFANKIKFLVMFVTFCFATTHCLVLITSFMMQL